MAAEPAMRGLRRVRPMNCVFSADKVGASGGAQRPGVYSVPPTPPSEDHANAALSSYFAGRRRNAGGSHVLHRCDQVFVEKIQAAFDEELFLARLKEKIETSTVQKSSGSALNFDGTFGSGA